MSAEEYLTRRQLFRVLTASTIGNTIEFYDFGIYGLVASLYLGKLFFPAQDPLASTVAAFTTFTVGFVARPVGAAIFGHFGDRVGRKATLISTLSLMGVATLLIGLMPTYEQVGIAGGIMLAVLRVLQGMALGGEWAGSVVLTLEWAHRRRDRGFLAAIPHAGHNIGTGLATVALGLSTLWLGSHSYWAWRLPFLVTIVLVAVGLYVRVGILVSPVFSKLLEERRVERRPVLSVLRRSWRDVLSICFMRAGQQGVIFVFNTFVLTYGTLVLHLPQGQVITWVVIATFLQLLAGPFWARIGDRIGRKRMLLIGMVAMLLFAYPYWMMLDTRMPIVVALAILLSLPIHDMQFGPQAAFIPETFTGRLRYSGSSLGYHLAAAVVGGTGPLLAAALLQRYHTSSPIALYMMVCALVSIIAIGRLPDRSRQDISIEYDAPPGKQPASVTAPRLI